MCELLACQNGSWKAHFVVLGFDSKENNEKIWNVSENIRGSVIEFSLFMNKVHMPDDTDIDSDEPENSPLARIEKALNAIKVKLSQGVKIRLF